MSLLRVIGTAYLLYLAWGALRKAIHPPVLTPADMAPRAPWRHFTHGYLLQVTNPKAVAFWLAIASFGAVEGASTGIALLFVAGAFGISLCCHAAWGLALSAWPVRAAYAKTRRGIESLLGGFFSLPLSSWSHQGARRPQSPGMARIWPFTDHER